MSARGPSENTYASITTDFQTKMSSKLSKDLDSLKNATPVSLKVNGGMIPHYAYNKGRKRSLVVMNALPAIEGATEFDIINDHYDRQFNVAICGATGNVGR